MKDRDGSIGDSSFRGEGMKEWAARGLGGHVGGGTKDSRDNKIKQKEAK